MFWLPFPCRGLVTGGHPWFASPAAIRCHRYPGGFLGCVLDSFVHVWFVPGSVSRFSRSTGAVKPPQNEQPELLRVSFASPSTLCRKVLGRQRGFGETPGTPCPLARWHGGAWLHTDGVGRVGRGFFKVGNVLKAKGTVCSCPVPGSVRTFGKFYVELKSSLALSVVSSGTGECRAASARSGGDGKG